MSRAQDGKTRAAEFGKRGRESDVRAERRPTALQRLTKAGGRWWGKLQPKKKKKDPRALGFRRARPGT